MLQDEKQVLDKEIILNKVRMFGHKTRQKCVFNDETAYNTDLDKLLFKMLNSEDSELPKYIKKLKSYTDDPDFALNLDHFELLLQLLCNQETPTSDIHNVMIILNRATQFITREALNLLPDDTISILLLHFPHPIAIDVVSNLITLDAHFGRILIQHFAGNESGFCTYFISLMRPQLMQLPPILHLLQSLANDKENLMKLVPLFNHLVQITSYLENDIQIIAFSTILAFCEDNKTIISSLINNESLSILFTTVPQSPGLLTCALKAADVITASISDCVDFVERANLSYPSNLAITSLNEPAIVHVCIIYYNLCLSGVDGIAILIKSGIFPLLLELHGSISYATWKEVVYLISCAIQESSEDQFLDLVNEDSILFICEYTLSSEGDEEIIQSISCALNQIIIICGNHPENFRNLIFTQDLHDNLQQLVQDEDENSHIVSDFVNSVDSLFAYE